MKKKLVYLLMALITLAGFIPGGLPNITPPAAYAAGGWPSDPAANLAISTANGDQYAQQMTSDNAGGAIIVWQDFRSGGAPKGWDIYAQKVDASGAIQWTAGGAPVNTVDFGQQAPVICSDGAGGAIIVWQDSRVGPWEIYAQRIDASGALQWAADGIPIALGGTFPFPPKTNPRIAPDGSGGAIIIWEDLRATNTDIYAQRINSAGAVQWTANGIPVTAAASDQVNPRIVSGGQSNSIITWQDWRNGSWDIYAQKINPSGTANWTADGVPVITDGNIQINPILSRDGTGGAIIIWEDGRSGGTDIYAQRIDSTGAMVWASTGVPITTAGGTQNAQAMLPSVSGNSTTIVWQDFRNGSNYDIYAQSIDLTGVVQWTPNGVLVTAANADQTNPRLSRFTGDNSTVITWQDFRNGNMDIYAQRMSPTGAALWTVNGVPVSTASGHQMIPRMSTDSAGPIIIAWEDYRSGTSDIYAQGVNSDGSLGPQAPPPPNPSIPLAIWHFNEGNGTTVYDSSGNNQTGTFHGAPTWVPGISGSALRLIGNDYVDVGTDNVFNFNDGTGNFTIDAWIKLESMQSYSSVIVAKMTDSPYSGWGFYVYGSNPGGQIPPRALAFGGAAVWEVTSAPDMITAGIWTHVAVTKSAGTYTLYKNGIAVASFDHGNLETSTTSLKVGRNFPDGSPNPCGLDGLIDEVHIYNYALTAEQIAAVAVALPPSLTTNNPTNLTANSARLSGNLTSLGTASSANVSFQWGLNSENYTGETPIQTMNVTGLFSANLTGLSGNTTYYFRAKAAGDNVSYGAEKSFTTLNPITPPPFLLKWGAQGSGNGEFNIPNSVAVDNSGNVYVADNTNNRIQKFNSAGVFLTQWGSLGANNGEFNLPYGLAVDSESNVYVADTWNHRIQKFSSTGVFLGKWGAYGTENSTFNLPYGVTVDSTGNVYVSDHYNHRIQKFTTNGVFLTKWGTLGANDGEFNLPTGMDVDSIGNVYVSDSYNHRIQKFSAAGVFLTKWGSIGAGNGEFSLPVGLAVSNTNNIYVADVSNNRIQEFSPAGVFLTQWGSAGNGNGQFNGPCGIAVDNMDNVYVADTNNHRIQVFGIAAPPPPPPPQLPDLAIIDAHEVWTVPGSTYRMFFTVKNVGNAVVPSGYDVGLNVNGTPIEQVPALSSLAPGDNWTGSFTSNITLHINISGSFDVVAVQADVNNEIAEPDENNNWRKNIISWPAKPNLVVYKWEEWLAQGQTYKVHYNLTNGGNALALAGHDTELKIDGVALETRPMPVVLNPGQSYSDVFNYTANLTGGVDSISVTTDINNEVVESIEGDNTMLNTLSWPAKPDLIIRWKNERWVPWLPGHPPSQYNVQYSVQNIGNMMVPAGFVVQLSIDGIVTENRTIPVDLQPNQEYSEFFSTTITISGISDNITVTADINNQVDESIESNNSLTNTWSVPLNGTVVAIGAPPKVSPGSDFIAYVKIGQVQSLDAGNFDVSFNPAVLGLDNVTDGNIGNVIMPIDGWNLREPGRYSIVTNLPELTGVSGNGSLAALHFHVLGSLGQSSNITLSSGILSNNLAQEIPATWIDGFIQVSALPGDADGDGNVDAVDITKTERIIAHLDQPTPGADANQDGLIDALDITKVERIIVGLN